MKSKRDWGKLSITLTLLVQIIGRPGMRKDNEKTKFSKCYEGQDIVESPDCLRPEATSHIE